MNDVTQPDQEPRATRRWPRVVAIVLGTLVLLVLVIPLVWPVPPLRGVQDPYALRDADSKFVTVDGMRFHYKEAGSREASCTVLLLHGFGASVFSWEKVLPELGSDCRVVAFDRPAFGLTSRPLPGDWNGTANNPYTLEASAKQTVKLMDALGIDRATLVGHSAGGAVAAVVAARYPDRVHALVLEDPAILERGGTPGWLAPVLRTPQFARIGPLLVRRIAGPAGDSLLERAFYDSARLTPEVISGYRRPLRAENWDKALWAFSTAPQTLDPADVLGEIRQPTLVIAGRNDRIVDYESIVKTARMIPGARLETYPETGHIPHEERPDTFVRDVERFLDSVESTAPASMPSN